ncbi:MAG: TRAP transporter substrate-binding protein DctP [Qingshengfaniella sp.]
MTTSRLLMAAILTAATTLTTGAVWAGPKLTITLDTPPGHMRNVYVGHFAEALTERSNGELTVEIFDSGQLYSSRDAGRAVARGDAGMAIVSTAPLSRIEQNLVLTELPMFAGLTSDQMNAVVDGPLGQRLTAMLGEKMGVEAMIGWYILGEINTYSTKTPLNSLEDFRGLQTRHPGGVGAVAYLEELGANPVSMPYTDVPLALQQGTVDAIVSSNVSVLQASLHESGLRYAYTNRMVIGYYMPIVSRDYWGQLSAEQQQMFRDTWAEFVPGQRAAAAKQQADARATLEAAGMIFVEQPPEEAAALRARLEPAQDKLIKDLKISPDVLDLARDALK